MPQISFIKPKQIIGHHLILRDVEVEDSSFILNLRTDTTKSKYLSSTSNDLLQQIEWIKKYKQDNSQLYFLIQDQNLEQVGTVRLYDAQEDSFCWGSWILKANTPSGYSIESALIIYSYALSLGFTEAHFDVRKENESVWRFHERFGAIKVDETDKDYFFTISFEAIKNSLGRYSKYLPKNINIIL
ncbi:MAG TPA: GNAT family N-acetyltransferase [Rickettsia endosymbiont of Degeeriella rufa]|nr:GNAT family N-acetyltransferase [Rickettsia endosymbiont of Degeeriella rufa]